MNFALGNKIDMSVGQIKKSESFLCPTLKSSWSIHLLLKTNMFLIIVIKKKHAQIVFPSAPLLFPPRFSRCVLTKWTHETG